MLELAMALVTTIGMRFLQVCIANNIANFQSDTSCEFCNLKGIRANKSSVQCNGTPENENKLCLCLVQCRLYVIALTFVVRLNLSKRLSWNKKMYRVVAIIKE